MRLRTSAFHKDILWLTKKDIASLQDDGILVIEGTALEIRMEKECSHIPMLVTLQGNMGWICSRCRKELVEK